MTTYDFHLTAQWPGGRNGVGNIQCGELEIRTSIATAMGGPGVGTNPDELLLAAAGMCFFMTFAAVVERAGLMVDAMSLASTMRVGTDPRGAYVCQRIIHRPRVALATGASAADLRRLDALAEAAEQRCMISAALRGNVEILIEPDFALAGPPQ
jgi:peroxiredoxin-like protein